MQYNNGSYKKLMISFNILTSLNRRLLEENRPDDKLQTFLEKIESECVKKIPTNNTINFFLTRINEFLKKYRHSLHTKTYHHIKNLRSYELFFPEDIVKEMQNTKQTKNDLLLGNKKDVEILNDLNKINPSNKMDENKKNSNHIKKQKKYTQIAKTFKQLKGTRPEKCVSKAPSLVKKHNNTLNKPLLTTPENVKELNENKITLPTKYEAVHKYAKALYDKKAENELTTDNKLKQKFTKHKRANAYINLDNCTLGKSNDNKILS